MTQETESPNVPLEKNVWCMHDYPTYGMMVGTTNKGFAGCPVCGPFTPSRSSSSLGKVVHRGEHRRWLPFDHGFRQDEVFFVGGKEDRPPPAKMTCTLHLRWAALKVEYIQNGVREGGENDPTLDFGVKRVPCMFLFPYWKVRNILNFMYLL